MKFQDTDEFELHLSGLAGIAGTIAIAAFQSEGETSEIYRSASFLQNELEHLATHCEILTPNPDPQPIDS